MQPRQSQQTLQYARFAAKTGAKRTCLRTLCALLFYCLTAHSALVCAANWLPINNGSLNRVEIAVDSASLQQVGDALWQLWYRETYATPHLIESGAFSFSRLLAHIEFKCTQRLATPLRTLYFTADGHEIEPGRETDRQHTPNSPGGKGASPVLPDSTLEQVFNYACQGKEKKKKAAPVIKKEVTPPPVLAAAASDNKLESKKNKAPKSMPAPPVAWAYEGKNGATKWGKLSPDYALCEQGQRQSPIDIRATIKTDLPAPQFAYSAVPLSIIDNGHTLQVDTRNAGAVSLEGEEYELQQFHFHKPAEEKINGKSYDMAVHLVHKSSSGKTLVMTIFLQAGAEHKLIRSLWNHIPLQQGVSVNKAEVEIDPMLLLPKSRGYFLYMGSQTTPPCQEGVLSLVLKTPIFVSQEQINSFGKIYKNNARPIQPANGRVIKTAN